MQDQSEIIEQNPIGDGLDFFRSTIFRSVCQKSNAPCSQNALRQLPRTGESDFSQSRQGERAPDRFLDLEEIASWLLSKLSKLPAATLLPSVKGCDALASDLSRLSLAGLLNEDNEISQLLIALLESALAPELDEALLWSRAYHAARALEPVSPPSPSPTTLSIAQTKLLRKTSSFSNTSENVKQVERVLRQELGMLYVGLSGFHLQYFGGIVNLRQSAAAFLKQCSEGGSPLFNDGWVEWPQEANQEEVLGWLEGFSCRLRTYAESRKPPQPPHRHLIAAPNKPLKGSVGTRKLDVGFFTQPPAGPSPTPHWSQVLVPGELKRNPSADHYPEAWLDIAKYVREVLSSQDARRFALAFTLCGSLMRVWAFDRLGGVASDHFDINRDPLSFVYTMLGFLWMDEEHLGFDPTIVAENEQRFIEIQRNNKGPSERIIIDQVIHYPRCINGRATTCWKAHPQGQPEKSVLIKDSWQYPQRPEEGDFLREVMNKKVTNVARYYHHETVKIRGMVDDIRANVRGNLDVTKAQNYRPDSPVTRSATASSASKSQNANSGNTSIGRKRSSHQRDAPLRRSSRQRVIRQKSAGSELFNRIHRRIILLDTGKHIYEASSLPVLLTALAGCIEGHECLYRAGFLHRDISIENLMINEEEPYPRWSSFLIDLDMAVREPREAPTGAQERTGTRAFMSIGVLQGEFHCFMHDLESFFWVLFWFCIHYHGPGNGRVHERFDAWNYLDMESLACLKLGLIVIEQSFTNSATEHFTPFCQPLIPLVLKLRDEVFPDGKPWQEKDDGLYSRMRRILLEAARDPAVAAEQ